MNRERPPAVLRCPHCGFPITARTTTCENCHSFIPVADIAANGGLNRLISLLFGRQLASLSLPDVARLLAWIPLVIGPPVASLAIVGIKVAQDPARLHQREWQGPALIAALNIALSLVVWHYAAQELGDLARSLGTGLADFIHGVRPGTTGRDYSI